MKDKGFGDEFCECEKCLSIHLKGDTSEEEYAERVVKERNDLRKQLADRDAALSEAMDELRLRRDATAITYQPKRSANG